jgi:hypothetical protein
MIKVKVKVDRYKVLPWILICTLLVGVGVAVFNQLPSAKADNTNLVYIDDGNWNLDTGWATAPSGNVQLSATTTYAGSDSWLVTLGSSGNQAVDHWLNPTDDASLAGDVVYFSCWIKTSATPDSGDIGNPIAGGRLGIDFYGSEGWIIGIANCQGGLQVNGAPDNTFVPFGSDWTQVTMEFTVPSTYTYEPISGYSDPYTAGQNVVPTAFIVWCQVWSDTQGYGASGGSAYFSDPIVELNPSGSPSPTPTSTVSSTPAPTSSPPNPGLTEPNPSLISSFDGSWDTSIADLPNPKFNYETISNLPSQESWWYNASMSETSTGYGYCGIVNNTDLSLNNLDYNGMLVLATTQVPATDLLFFDLAGYSSGVPSSPVIANYTGDSLSTASFAIYYDASNSYYYAYVDNVLSFQDSALIYNMLDNGQTWYLFAGGTGTGYIDQSATFPTSSDISVTFVAGTGGTISWTDITSTGANGTNLILNPSFESGSADWNLDPYATVSSAEAHTGSYSLQLANGGQATQSFSPYVNIGSGVTLTFWVLGNLEGSEEIPYWGTVLLNYGADNLQFNIPQGNYVSWTPISYTFTPPPNNVNFEQILFGLTTSATPIYIDDISLTSNAGTTTTTGGAGTFSFPATDNLAVTATANTGYQFTYFTDTGALSMSITSNPYLNVLSPWVSNSPPTSNDLTITANFVAPSTSNSPPPGPIISGKPQEYYFRSDTYTTFGVSGYGFDSSYTNTPQTVTESYGGTDAVNFGFQVFLYTSTGQSVELTDGPSGIISVSGNYTGADSSIFNMPLTNVVLGYNALQILVEEQYNGGSWATVATFVSPTLITNNIVASTWQFTIYINNIQTTSTTTSFNFGDSQVPSGISNIVFSTPLRSDIAMWDLSRGDYVGLILFEYMAELGTAFYAIVLLGISGSLYWRYRHSGIIVFFFALLISGGFLFAVLPIWAASVAAAIVLLGGTFLVYRVLR